MGNSSSSKTSKEPFGSTAPSKSKTDIYIPPSLSLRPNFNSKPVYRSLAQQSSTTSNPFSQQLDYKTNNLRLHLPGRPKPIPTENISNYVNRSSWDIWHQLADSESLNAFSTRIKDNVKKLNYEDVAHKAKLLRIKENHRFICEQDVPNTISSIDSFLDRSGRFEDYRIHDHKNFPSKKRLPELTPYMLDKIKNATQPRPASCVISDIDGAQILKKDIDTLVGLNWLNDEIVNAYMNLLVLRSKKPGYKKVYAFNTFFYPKIRESGYSSVRRWTRKVDVFSYSFLLVPVHLGNHWCLAVIDFDQRSISYYDSLSGSPHGCCDTLLDYLREESSDKKKQDFDDENWRLIDMSSEGIPTQHNGSDCGVFACTYAEYITRQASLDFSQENMRYLRQKMIYEIISKSIIE